MVVEMNRVGRGGRRCATSSGGPPESAWHVTKFVAETAEESDFSRQVDFQKRVVDLVT